MSSSAGRKRLHVGCGRTIMPGWINLDCLPGPGVDVEANLEDCANTPLPFESDSIDDIFGSHLLEHINNVLALMQELHRIAKPSATAIFRLPYGSSDDAFEDPTHVRNYFVNSFGYFSQPFFWRADYGYRGDWQPEQIILNVSKQRYQGKSQQLVLAEVMSLRNVVQEMTVGLTAIKPIRPARPELQRMPKVEVNLV